MIFLSVFLGVFFGILCAELVLFLLRRRTSGEPDCVKSARDDAAFAAAIAERRKTKNISKSGNLVLGGDHDSG